MESSAGSSDGSTARSLERIDKTGTEMNRIKVAEREQRRVVAFKTIMMLVLAGVAAGLSTATYLFVKQGEQDDFENDVSGWPRLVTLCGLPIYVLIPL